MFHLDENKSIRFTNSEGLVIGETNVDSVNLRGLRRCDTISSFSSLPPNSIIIEFMDSSLFVPVDLYNFLLDNKIIEGGDEEDIPPPSEVSLSVDEIKDAINNSAEGVGGVGGVNPSKRSSSSSKKKHSTSSDAYLKSQKEFLHLQQMLAEQQKNLEAEQDSTTAEELILEERLDMLNEIMRETGEMEKVRERTSGVEWSGVEWSGVEWSGVGWSGVEWSGVEWSGVEWGGATEAN